MDKGTNEKRELPLLQKENTANFLTIAAKQKRRTEVYFS
jgi:hypothetical protein